MIELTSVQVLEQLRIADVIREHASGRPDVVAVKCGPRSLTYAELHDRSNRLAQVLLAAGVRAGDRVAHLDRTAPEILELLFAFQSHGTARVAAFFGPIMLLWFVIIAIGGLWHVMRNPAVLRAFNPSYGVAFLASHGMIGLVALVLIGFITVIAWVLNRPLV